MIVPRHSQSIFCACLSGLLLLLASGRCWSDDALIRETLLQLNDRKSDVRIEALNRLVQTGDPRLESVLESYRQGSLYLYSNTVYYCEELVEDDDFNEWAPLADAISQEPVYLDGEQLTVSIDDVDEISPGRKERKLAGSAKFLLKLASPEAEVRLAGARKCGNPPLMVEALDRLKELAESDPDSTVKRVAHESLLLIRFEQTFAEPAGEDHLSVVAELGRKSSMRALPRLEEKLAALKEGDREVAPAVSGAYVNSMKAIRKHQGFVDRFGSVFQGLSLGSVLILMALGLAITFGLMGVINMAHGELMMIGAYATYEMQMVFVRMIDRGDLSQAAYDWYYVCAGPAAFLAAAFVGYLMEITVVRHLYRRPLESLLATWGVGLILIQIVRIRYGDNIGVNAPHWARGGVEVFQDVILPYSRCFIIGLAVLCVGLIYFIMNRTGVGLRMRATMQNREMANSMGVNTGRVDRFTFAFGSGIAGIAGYAWTLIGGVTPDMGQKNFIVDSFLVVVTGGVGELMGVICAGLGIGVISKLLEPMTIGGVTIGAIWAKVILLVVIVIFIQFKPAGLFAPKGRLADV